MSNIAVVILNWNGEAFLKRFLPILISNTQLADTEIVVADNASTDNSLRLLETDFPTIKTIVLDQNYGFAGGYNRALEQIEAKYFVLLNSDVEVTENWLLPLFNYLEQNKEVAACQPKIKSIQNREFFEHAGAAGGFIDFLGFPFCRGRVLSKVEEDKGQYDNIADVFWASGACFMVRADLFKKLGGFDDVFFAHMEEIDLCWRFNSRGYRVVCVPESTVYHVGGGTLKSEHPYKTYLNFRNNLLMLYKNLPQKELNSVLKWRKIIDYIAFSQMMLTGKSRNAMSVIRARKDFKKLMPEFETKRNENILYATRTQCAEMLNKSIIVEYYFKWNRTFNHLYDNSKSIGFGDTAKLK